MPKCRIPGASSLDQVLGEGLFEETVPMVLLNNGRSQADVGKRAPAGGIPRAKALRQKRALGI